MKSFVVIVLLVVSTKIKLLTSITHGELAEEMELPYMVGVRSYYETYAKWCGGTLISDQWILTAAQCAESANSVDVHLGALDRFNPNENGQTIISVDKENVIVHEDYEDEMIRNDITLIKLPSPVELNDYIKPATLPEKNINYADLTGANAIISGWGGISDEKKYGTDKLRWVEVPILDNSDCGIYYGGLPTQICVNTEGGKSTCEGDAGGALVLADDSNTVIGIFSMGMASLCEQGIPVAFTNVHYYLNWIAEKSSVDNTWEISTHGELAEEIQLPYMVGVKSYYDAYTNWCGGTLISDQWILTAVLCTESANSVDVHLGALNSINPNENGQTIISVDKENVIVHEDYEDETIRNDISLIKLPSPVQLNDYIKPANLPKKNINYADYTGANAITVGLGAISDRRKYGTDKLHWIEAPIIDNSDCSNYYGGLPTQICVNTEGGKSTCDGDYGGPLILADGSITVVGITSVGMPSRCEQGTPVAFTNIHFYLNWIAEKSGIVNE